MLYSADGLVIREIKVGEYDKIITLITPTEGQISVTAKGASSSKSKLIACTKLFTYGNYEIYKKGDLRYLREGAIIEPFFALSVDIERMALASYLCEIAGEVSGEGESSYDILRITLNALFAISRGLRPLSLIKAVYELRTAGYSGFTPSLDGCFVCKEAFPQNPYFDIMNGHVLCGKCMEKLQVEKKIDFMRDFDDLSEEKLLFRRLTPSVLSAMKYVFSASPRRLFSFEITDKVDMNLFSQAGETFLLNHLERDFRTLNFYKSLF